MINIFFIEIRNFIFVWLKRNHGEDYANKEYEFRMGVFWTLYYIVFVVIITLIISNLMPPLNLSVKTSFILKKNFFVKLFGGMIIFLPYYLWLKYYLFEFLRTIPINEIYSDAEYKRSGWKTFFTFVVGFLLILITGVINNLLKTGHL